MDIELRDYQEQSIEALRQNIRGGVKNQILAAPTGSGKTVCAAHLLDECYRKRRRAVFVADRVNLIDQTSATLDQYGVPHGVIQGDHWRRRPYERIQVASPQTLARRAWPEADLIIVDEAHGLHRTVAQRIARRDVVTIGLTATPFTKGLGKYYDSVVTVRTTNQLITDGYLSPFRVWAASEPDMQGVKVDAGEWNERETAKRAMPIVGDCVAEYLRHAQGKKFIAFAVNVEHCAEMQRQFLHAGITAELYTYHTSDDERARMVAEFRKPDSYIRGLISVGALAKGFDVPDVEVVIMARPLRSSFAEHIQILGRGLRRHPGKAECIVLDHAGNCLRFWGQMQEFFEHGATELDDGKRKEKAATAAKKEAEPFKCPRCAHVHARRPACPSCGHEYPKRSEVEHRAGELRELSGSATSTKDEKQDFYSQLLYVSMERGYKPGWVGHKYHERFNVWPRGLEDHPIPPTRSTMNWIRSRQIAYAKAREVA